MKNRYTEFNLQVEILEYMDKRMKQYHLTITEKNEQYDHIKDEEKDAVL